MLEQLIDLIMELVNTILDAVAAFLTALGIGSDPEPAD